MFFRKRRKLNKIGIDFDEILMDSKNLGDFDTQQFEGRIEQTISKQAIWSIGLVFSLVIVIFAGRLHALQIKKGEEYRVLSEKNSLDSQIIFADRGVIFDRNGIELAWNERTPEMTEFDFSHRAYTKEPGASVLLGYIKYPQKDKKGYYWQTNFTGMDGIEKEYNDDLSGENGSKIIEVDALGEVGGENILNSPEHGKNITLTIDQRLQSAMYNSMKTLSEDIGYQGGAGAIMDLSTGELIVATSFPEYDPGVITDGSDDALITSYFQDQRKPFLNRFVSGLYSPGSIVKPFIAIGALNEGIITPSTTVLSTGEIKVPNPYDPELSTTFKDWKEGGHGVTDVRKALAESVNTFFYAISGGYKGQKGMGIAKIEEYIRLFDIGDKTNTDIGGEVSGTVPSPEWKKRIFNGEAWRLGDTYHTAIGQYGFQVTPAEMLRAISAIANDGTLVTPHVVMNTEPYLKHIEKNLPAEDYEVIREGLRSVITEGTGQVLNVPYVHLAGKTGTAQAGVGNKYINSWTIGFFPYEDPKYAYVLLMEKGPKTGDRSASFALRTFLDWMKENTPEYFGLPPAEPKPAPEDVPTDEEQV